MVLLLGLQIPTRAQFTQTVKGSIQDVDSEFPLWGASVLLLDDSLFIGGTTDSLGNFKLTNVPVGRRSFAVSYLGYETRVIKEAIVGSAKEVILNVSLKEKLTALKEVEITASKDQPLNSMTSVSARVFSTDEASRYAGSFEDPGRMAQSFAGVSNDGDYSNELVIRGNSSRGVLWRMEGIEIPNPNHFRSGEGASGGGISILSSNVLANSDFLTGAFPAEYGNATAGVFDIKLRKGNPSKREYTVLLGILGTEIGLEGPLSKKQESSYLLHYRYSTLGILDNIGINIAGDVVPKYQDLSFNLFTKTKRFGQFSLFGIAGYSSAKVSALKDSTKWNGFRDQENEEGIQTMGVFGLSNTYLLKDQKTFIRSIVSTSLLSDQYRESYYDYNYNDNQTYRQKFDYPGWRTSVLVNTKLNNKNTFRSGLIYSALYFDLLIEEFNSKTNLMEADLKNSGNTGLVQGYTQWKRRLGANFDLNMGLHYTQFLLNGNSSLEPRLGAVWKMSENQSLNMGLGIHSKVEAVSIYMAERTIGNEITLPNENLDLMKSAHLVFGYSRSISKNVNLKLETYYQYLYDVPIYDTISYISALNFGSGYTNSRLSNGGSGTNYGLELTLEKYFSNGYFYMITGSLFDSKYIAGDKIERNTVFNSNFVTNFIGGKEFKVGDQKQNVFGVNARAIWKGGNRKIPINLKASILDSNEVYDLDRIYNSRLPDYFRIDLGLSYRINKAKLAWVITLDIQNLINRQNVYYEFYNEDTQQVDYVYQLGTLPVLKFKVVF
ncbi:MAG: TonB-dependent receptor [Flavobacteriales bacterium]|nr:TonB-dependent receptor [Flavobacteriales bacterium]